MDFCPFPLSSQFKTVIPASQPFIQEERRTNLHLTVQHMRLSNCAPRGREPKERWQGHKDHKSATGVYMALWCSFLFLGTSERWQVGETCHILANMWNILRVCCFIYKQFWFKIAPPEQNSLDSYSLLSSCSEAVGKFHSKRNFFFTEVLHFIWFLHNWGVNCMDIPSWE